MVRRISTTGVFLLAVLASASAAQSQQAELRARIELDAQTPLSGALVALVDATNRVTVEVLSSGTGRVSVTAPAGEYRLRVRRVGFRPFYSEPLTIPRPDELVLRVESPRVVLNSMVVSAAARCGPIPAEAETLAALWEEISKALKSSQLTVEDLSGVVAMHMYRRELGRNGEVIAHDSTISRTRNSRPFGAIDPDTLAASGYVRGDEVAGWHYFGPDETVLLSRGFTATHCFRIARDNKRPGQIGLAFAPLPRRKQSDIEGVLWLDAGTAELREIRFQFVNAGILSRFDPGGFTRFVRMRSGAWLVSEWQLRMPRLERNFGSYTNVVLIGHLEHGGKVLLAGDSPDGTR